MLYYFPNMIMLLRQNIDINAQNNTYLVSVKVKLLSDKIPLYAKINFIL